MRKILFAALLLTTLVTGFSIASTSALSLPSGDASITATTFKQDACDGISQLGGSNPCSDSGQAANNKLSDTMATIVNLLSYIVGIVAVIMVIVAGFKYITSGGDSAKVSSAKSTLVYAIVGLIIVALAQFIVHFVLGNI